MNRNFKRNLLLSSGISIVVLLISSIASFLSIRNLLESNWWVSHTYEVIYNIDGAALQMTEAQTSMRGFLVTGKEEFLENYRDNKEKTDDYLAEVASLTVDNGRQQRIITELTPLKNSLFEFFDTRINSKKQGIVASANDLDTGKKLMDDVKKILKRMEEEEKRLLVIRTSKSERYSNYSLLLIIAASLIALVSSVIFFIRIVRDYNQRLTLQKKLEDNERETAERIQLISATAGAIASGNYDIRVTDAESDALGSVSASLNHMAVALGISFGNLSDKEWLQSGIAGLNSVMINEMTLGELTLKVLEYVCLYTGSSVGAFYLAEENSLHFQSGFSYKVTPAKQHILFGEGLTGQAAENKKILELKVPDTADIIINYALGEIKPLHILAIPMIHNNVAGVAEVGAIREFSKREIEFFREASHNIAIAITTARGRSHIQELLEETQAQSEELRVQHSELENMNAELEAQTQKLQASEEELRVQQEELQQTNGELANRSALLEDRNREVQKKSEDLELSTRYKSEFLANMSHELRTPLNSILLLSRLLSENTDKNMNNEQVEFAKVVHSSGNGLLALIDEILDLSKIESGKMELELEDLAVTEITQGLNSLFSEITREKGIRFTILDTHAPLVIRTDRMRLEQILKNLLSNAIKFTDQGEVTMKVTQNGDDRKSVAFIVSDTGIGIPAEKQPLVFEAFQQADGSTKRKYGGTGLGLSISRELAKLLQGTITLESVPGVGSTFTLIIPILGITIAPTETSNTTQDLPDAILISQPTVINNYLSLTIPEDVPDDRQSIGSADKVMLIVEDDVNFAKTLLDFSRKNGYKGIVSVRGDHALHLAVTYKPVGILLDIQLPIKSGWEVMEELKSNLQTRHIPVHIMSSHNLRHESLLKGAVNFLDKPVAYEQIPEVFKRIENVINQEAKKILIFEDNPKHARALAHFLEYNNINSEIKSEITEGLATLENSPVNCVILDMGIPSANAYEILENVKMSKGHENLPVIVFTGKSLSMQEEAKIKKYADSIVVKTAHSYQRILDEVSLFLHLVEDSPSATKVHTKKHLPADTLGGKTILVVDDDVRNIYSLTKALEVFKINVLTAIDGKEALLVLKDQPDVDIVLLDMMMPQMDGYETASRIRAIKRFKNLPVIAVTAKAMTGDREKCIKAGASDYITKPVDMDQLLSLLRVWLYSI